MSHPVIYSSSRSISYDANAGTTFEVPFPVFDYADLRVYVEGVLRSDWAGVAISCGVSLKGQITFTAQVTGQVSIVSRRDPRRTYDFVEGAGLSADAINTDLDRLTATDQELFRDLREAEDAIEAEGVQRRAKDAEHDAAFKRTLRTPKNINTIPVGADCHILSWQDGHVVNRTMDQMLMRAMSIRQRKPSPLTLCDIKQGIYFGCPPDIIEPWACYDLPEAIEWGDSEPCEVLAEPGILTCMGQISTGEPPTIRYIHCPEEQGDPIQVCLYSQFQEHNTERCCT